MASTCIHGFAPGTCLICQTLQTPATATSTKPAAGPAEGKRRRRAAKTVVVASTTAPTPVRPDAVIAPREAHRAGSGLGLRLLGMVLVGLIVLAAVWLVAGFVLHILHIVELVAVALAAGWAGWSLGVRHGRRSRA